MLSDTVKIVSSPEGSRCFLASGEQLQGVSRLAWSVGVDRIAVAEITLFSQDVEVEGVAQVAMKHPLTGDVQLVDHIAFEDGTSWGPSVPDVVGMGGGRRRVRKVSAIERDRRQAERFEEVQAELMGSRWTFEQADALIELIKQGTAHLPPPADRA